MAAMTMAFTEEEEYLLERYKLLKEKKRALQKFKEKIESKTKQATKREAPDSSQTPEDAKKKAEMLVASGCVKIAKTSVEREFKRARLPEKKHAREPLSDNETSTEKVQTAKLAMRDNYNSRFVKEQGYNDSDSSYTYRGYRGPRKGNTIFVKGFGLTEDIVKTAFNKFGTVLETRFETKDRNFSHGLVAFETCDEAKIAVDEMNGTMVSDVHLKVCFANQQLRPDGGKESEQLWSSRDYQPPSRQEMIGKSRELRTYSDDDDFF